MKAQEWVGLDTETTDGWVRVLATSEEEFIESRDSADLIDFIYQRLGPDRPGVFYNLKYDAGCILKTAAMLDGAGVRSKEFTVGGYRIKLIPGKALTIAPTDARGWGSVRVCYDAAQFYPGGLERNAAKVLGRHKSDTELSLDRARIGSEAGYYEAHREDIIRYCIQDCKLTRDLMAKFQADVREALGVYPKTWYSGASIAKAYLAQVYQNPFYDWPIDLIADSVAAYRGGIFTTPVLGRTENAVEYDINSAYPAALAHLPDLRDITPQATNRRHDDALLGLYLVNVRYDGTLPYYTQRGNTIYPVSMEPLPAWLTDIEIVRYPQVEVVRGWEWFGKKWSFLERPITEAYKARQALKKAGDSRERAYKTALNSMYGAFAETKEGWTKQTNLVYAAWTAGYIRDYIRDLIKMSGGMENTLTVATDAVFFRKDPKIPESEVLGDLKVGFRGTVVSYMNGMRLENGSIVSRGFRSLTPRMLVEAKGPSLRVKETGPLPLVKGIVRNDVSRVGSWVTEEKEIDLRTNLARYVYPVSDLTFETLLEREVVGYPLVVTSPGWQKILTPDQRDALERGERPGKWEEPEDE